MVAGSGGGAGYLINRMSELGKTSQSFVLFTILSLVSMLLFFAVGFIEKRTTPWANSSE
jgi:ABC-type nitrate/sulfonate/bicarbonate transport system permease component